jgi:hypothetical protein
LTGNNSLPYRRINLRERISYRLNLTLTLSYDVSRLESYTPLKFRVHDGDTVFAIVEEGPDGLWRPIALEKFLPSSLPPNRAVLRGRVEGSWIVYGIERFYVPETMRDEIAKDLQSHLDAARAEVRVNARGDAALVGLRIEDRVYK